MPAYPLRALVLRKTKLGEADTIVTLLAEDGREVRAVAKGARKTTNRLGARLEPFTVADLLLHTGRTLDIVTEARTVATHEAVRRDFDRTAAASVVVELADKLSVEGQAEERLYALSATALDVLDDAPLESLDALVAAFLIKAVAMHGLRPQLASCATCAAALGTGARFSPASGGAVCGTCGEHDANALPLDAASRDLLAALLRARLAEIAVWEPDQRGVSVVLRLLHGFVAYHLHGRLKALEFFLRR